MQYPFLDKIVIWNDQILKGFVSTDDHSLRDFLNWYDSTKDPKEIVEIISPEEFSFIIDCFDLQEYDLEIILHYMTRTNIILTEIHKNRIIRALKNDNLYDAFIDASF